MEWHILYDVEGLKRWLCLHGTYMQIKSAILHEMQTPALRVQAFFHTQCKTFQVYHVYCIFILGYTCRITVNFGMLKDKNLLINIFASNDCFSDRNVFLNGVDTLSKIDNAFLTKS